MIIKPNENILLNWQEITEKYPNAWVLVGIPETEKNKSKNERTGFVLFAGEDENEFNDFAQSNFKTYFDNQMYQKIFTKFTGTFQQKETIKRVGLFRKIE